MNSRERDMAPSHYLKILLLVVAFTFVSPAQMCFEPRELSARYLTYKCQADIVHGERKKGTVVVHPKPISRRLSRSVAFDHEVKLYVWHKCIEERLILQERLMAKPGSGSVSLQIQRDLDSFQCKMQRQPYYIP